MKSVERCFNEIREKKLGLSSYGYFAEAVRNQWFSFRIIRFWFHKLVEKEDYAKEDKKEILLHLEALSKQSEGGRK